MICAFLDPGAGEAGRRWQEHQEIRHGKHPVDSSSGECLACLIFLQNIIVCLVSFSLSFGFIFSTF